MCVGFLHTWCIVILDCGLVLHVCGLPAYLVYCDMGKHPDLAKSTLYGHYVRALDVLFGYWPCLYGKQPMADPHC